MRRSLAAVTVAVLALTAGCAGVFGAETPSDGVASATDHQPGSGGQTVAVATSGSVQTAPDQAVVRVAVTARSDSVETVRERLAANSSRMRTALEDSGLSAEQITSAHYDIERNHRAEEDPSAPEYQGRHAFVITLENTSRAGSTVVTAVQNGATRVDGVRFTITDETRTELKQQALNEAVRNAHDRAAVLANGTDLELAGVHTVQTSSVSMDHGRELDGARVTAMAAGGDGGRTSFEAGKVTVSAQVQVVYNATRP